MTARTASARPKWSAPCWTMSSNPCAEPSTSTPRLQSPTLFSFRAEGGSVAGLLRALQPALRLGSPDALPLRAMGARLPRVVLAHQGGALGVLVMTSPPRHACY